MLAGLGVVNLDGHTDPRPTHVAGSARHAASRPAPPGGSGGERFDEPDAAEAYYRARRAGPTGRFDADAAYARARARIAAMPRYSSRLGAFVAADRSEERGSALGAEATSLSAGWESLGPGNVGGRTRVLVIDPGNADVMYATGVSGGVWKTTDGGASWRSLFDALPNITVNSLAMDPSDPATLYAGTGEGYFREVVRGTGLPLRGAGVFKTRDGGATWNRLAATSGEDFFWVNDLVISVNDTSRVYAATRTGVWRSLDGGESWRRILDTAVNGGCLDLALRTDRTSDFLFASCGTFEQATVYRNQAAERDGAWEGVLNELGMGRTSLAIAPSDQRVVYALAASNVPGPGGRFEQGLLGVFCSSADGDRGTWQARVRNTSTNIVDTLLLTNPIAAQAVQCGQEGPNVYVTMGWYVNVIAVDPSDENRVWAAGVDLFRSDDGGRTWGPVSYWWTDSSVASYVHADQHGITFHPAWNGTANQTMFAVGDGGVFRTDNALAGIGHGAQSLCNPALSAVRFRSLNHWLGVTQFYHGLPFPGGRAFFGGTQDNGTVIGDDLAGANGWRFVLGGDGGYVAIDPRDPNLIFAEAQGLDIYRSTDRGLTWTAARGGVTDPVRSFLFITPFLLDPANPQRLWSGGWRMWRTDNQARSWVAASTTFADGASMSAVAVAPTMPNRVVAGTNAGTIYRTDSAGSTSASSSWESAQPRAGFVTSVTFDPVDANRVYATYGGFGGTHVWRSADAGASWSGLDGEGSGVLPDIPVHCLLVDPDRLDRLFVGTDLGVFVSLDGGASWAVENTGFATVVTESLALTRDDDGHPVLFAFTHGRGAWRVRIDAPETEQHRPPRRRLSRLVE